MGLRPQGLHPKSRFVWSRFRKIATICSTDHRHVRKPRKHSFDKICEQVASFSGFDGKCIDLPPGGGPSMLCQPPMEFDIGLAPSIESPSSCHLSTDNPPLGFLFMVAPTSETAASASPPVSDTPLSSDVHELSRGIHAKTKMAPTLQCVIRKYYKANKFKRRPLIITWPL